jgi:hypothetical protein
MDRAGDPYRSGYQAADGSIISDAEQWQRVRAQGPLLAAGDGYNMGLSSQDPDRFRQENMARIRELARKADPGSIEYYRQADGTVRIQLNNMADETPAYMPGAGYADETRTFPETIVRGSREPIIGSELLDEGIERAGGTLLGVAGVVHGGAQFASDQFWALSNALSGGWLARNNSTVQHAVMRNESLGQALVNLPRQVSGLALRAVTGNWTGLGQGVSSALNVDRINTLNARGDYLTAQVLATQSALNVAGAAAGGLGVIRTAAGSVASRVIGAMETAGTGASLPFQPTPVPYGTPYRQLSNSTRSALLEKVDSRTITREEWARLQWNERLTIRRQEGIDAFWDAERQRLTQGLPGSRDWSPEAVQSILDGGQPRGIYSHHRYSVSLYAQLANDASTISPVTFYEHFYKWHGGNWSNPSHGVPLNPGILNHF